MDKFKVHDSVPSSTKRGRRKLERFVQESIPNRPARYPPQGSWPAELRADMVAAFLDFPTTQALAAAIVAGDAPRASGSRGEGSARELTWYLEGVKQFVASRHEGRAIARDGARLIDVIPKTVRQI
jgi:hypothetical protein